MKVDGEAVFSAVLTVTNEFGVIRNLVLVATKSHAEFHSALCKTRESLQMFGHSQPEVIYTDNPAADKQFLESIFPSITQGVVPVEKYPGLKSFVLPVDVTWAVNHTAAEISGACTRILDDLDRESPIVIGFDAEFNVSMIQGAGPEPTAIVQIAYKNHVDILQVC